MIYAFIVVLVLSAGRFLYWVAGWLFWLVWPATVLGWVSGAMVTTVFDSGDRAGYCPGWIALAAVYVGAFLVARRIVKNERQ